MARPPATPIRPKRPGKPQPRPRAERRPVKSGGSRPSAPDTLWLYGAHAVLPALANGQRVKRRLLLTERGAERYDLPAGIAGTLTVETVSPEALTRTLARAGAGDSDVPHQGLALACEPLPPADLDVALSAAEGVPQAHRGPVVVLDQVTDPHNVGAVFRSALAFGAVALVTQDRHSPAETATLAKAASGALEHLPWVRATNLARALDALADAGFWRVGLDGTAPVDLEGAAAQTGPVALVLGAEGRGLRPNVAKHCDALARIPIDPAVESLNVSNAAAVGLYAVTRARRA
ncbi:hypothetical protein CCR80_00845 [Rhodothalassium salexigens]|nr:RNA methyltransferase [Rhodothalassium salexigens]MBK5919586.1 hypothetical protein [Rhodothalassium salexigens]